MKIRNAEYITRLKYWNMDDGPEYRTTNIPFIIQNDGHISWDKSPYPIKDNYDHISWNARYPL